MSFGGVPDLVGGVERVGCSLRSPVFGVDLLVPLVVKALSVVGLGDPRFFNVADLHSVSFLEHALLLWSRAFDIVMNLTPCTLDEPIALRSR